MNIDITESKNPFFQMMDNLFSTNTVVLYGKVDKIDESQEKQVLDMLKNVYQNESIGYPHSPPPFDSKAAEWSAKVLFYATQLVMYREYSGKEIIELFPKYLFDKNASSILTADLCLRFLPDILNNLEEIDMDDELIIILNNILKEWNYSGLISNLPLDIDNISTILSSDCLTSLYVNRIVEYKRKEMGELPELKPLVLAALGNYKTEFWKDFNS